jgi:nitroreductase
MLSALHSGGDVDDPPHLCSLHPLICRRRSPRAFLGHPVARDDLLRLLEAARWAPSSFNEQPWSFIIAPVARADDFQAAISCLTPVNRAWAERASLLMFVVSHLIRSRDGQANRYAQHDVGLAVAHLNFQATAQGLGVHIMGGFDRARVRDLYRVPEEFEPLVALAIGPVGPSESFPDDIREYEARPRSRKSFHDFVFTTEWGNVAPEVR